MGSVIDYVDCPRCGGTMYDEYNYHTGETSRFCPACGLHSSAFIGRTDHGDWKREKREYLLDGSTILGARAFDPRLADAPSSCEGAADGVDGGKFLFCQPILADMREDDIWNWLNAKDERVAHPRLRAANLPSGENYYRNIFRTGTGAVRQLLFIGNSFHLERDGGAVRFFMDEAVWVKERAEGFGVFASRRKDNAVMEYRCLPPGDSAAAESIWVEFLQTPEHDLSHSYLTWWDERAGRLIELHGHCPEL